MGYLSLTIMELNIMNLHRRNMMFCSEWYGLIPPILPCFSPIYHIILFYPQLWRAPLRKLSPGEM